VYDIIVIFLYYGINGQVIVDPAEQRSVGRECVEDGSVLVIDLLHLVHVLGDRLHVPQRL